MFERLSRRGFLALVGAVTVETKVPRLTRGTAILPHSPSNTKRTQVYVSHFENVLGTSLELKIAAPSPRAAARAEAAALHEIGRLARILSTYEATSECCRWLRTVGHPTPLSPDLCAVLALFDHWRVTSHGALDASAEVLNQLWTGAAAQQRLPTPVELAQAVAVVRQPHWQLDATTQTAIHLSTAPVRFNSLAKGYILTQAADAARAAASIDAIVVNIGGDLVVAGDLTETVHVCDPHADAENGVPLDRLVVSNQAVATSGNYRRGAAIDGRWYSHIVDPRTGYPADHVLSATVVAPNATDAGALATIFNVLAPADSAQLAATLPGVEYLILTRHGERMASPGWTALQATREVHRATQVTDTTNTPDTSQTSHPKGAPSRWNPAYELVVDLQIALQPNAFAKRPYVAVWIADANHTAVRTLALWHNANKNRYISELKSWYLQYGALYDSTTTVFNSVSSATRPAGKYTVNWDGKDEQGNVVTPGVYTVYIEAAREDGTYQVMSQAIDCRGTPQHLSLPGNQEIAGASLEYRKRSLSPPS